MFIRKELNALVWLDQKVRSSKKASFLWRLSDKLSNRFLKSLDKKFAKDRLWCREIFNQYENDIWLLAQHLDEHPHLQNTYLTLFRMFGKDKTLLAYLEDRVLVNHKNVQRYGTQTRTASNYYNYLYPILGICEYGEMTSIDIKALNERRGVMGLESMENYADDLEKCSGIFLKFHIMV